MYAIQYQRQEKTHEKIDNTGRHTAGIGGGGNLAAQTCEVWVGFDKRSLVLFEGQSADLSVTADFRGPIHDDYILEVLFGTDPVPYWQQGQFNEGPVGSHGGTSTDDYKSTFGRLELSKSNPSKTITVQAMQDDETESNEKFYVNLSIRFNENRSTHRKSCTDPATHFKRYSYFATIHIRDGAGFTNHWLYGTGNN